MGDETEADVLDSLGDGAEEDDFGGDFAGGRDHGDWVDNRDGIEESLNKNVPDGSDVAIFDVDRAKQESETERKEIDLKNGWDGEEPGWTRGNAVDEGEDNNDNEIDEHVDNGG